MRESEAFLESGLMIDDFKQGGIMICARVKDVVVKTAEVWTGHALSTLLGTLSELEALLSLPWVHQSKHEVHITLLYNDCKGAGSRCRWRAQTGSFNLKGSKEAA